MVSNIKVSVIVPAYNAAKYLPHCLDSIIYQTYQNLEIICINDGSSDETLQILQNYEKKDKRINVLSQKNAGLSISRNVGIMHATGDYVSFIDADDWVLLDLYEQFIKVIQNAHNKVDIFMFNVGSYFKGMNDVYPRTFVNMRDWKNHTDENHVHTFGDCIRPFSSNVSAVNKIYRRNFLKKNHITFPAGKHYEDQYFSAKALLRAKSILITDRIYYRYRNYQNGSIITTESPKVFDIFDIIDLIESEIKKLNLYEKYKYAMFQYRYMSYFRYYGKCPENLRRKYFNKMKEELLKSEHEELDMNICRRLRNFDIFNLIMNYNNDQFEKLYFQKR